MLAGLGDCLQCFDSFTLLVGRQEEHPTCKNVSDEVLAGLSASSGVEMIS